MLELAVGGVLQRELVGALGVQQSGDDAAVLQRHHHIVVAFRDYGVGIHDTLQHVFAAHLFADFREIRADVAAFALHLVAPQARRLGLLGEDAFAFLRFAAFEALAPAGEGIGCLSVGFKCGELFLNRRVLPRRGGFEQIEHKAGLHFSREQLIELLRNHGIRLCALFGGDARERLLLFAKPAFAEHRRVGLHARSRGNLSREFPCCLGECFVGRFERRGDQCAEPR